jgi:hypothetical protein
MYPLQPNGLASLRQASGAKVAVASFVTETIRRQAQRFVRPQPGGLPTSHWPVTHVKSIHLSKFWQAVVGQK